MGNAPFTSAAGVPSTFFRGSNNEGGTTVPKAYINYIFLDEQFKFAGGSFSRVGSSGTVKDHWTDGLENINVPKNGYLFVYVSNESNLDVFFDNLQVVHKPGPLVVETHYYPFGLTMAGISSKAVGPIQNKEKTFQGQQIDDDLGLNWIQFKWRNHDPQIGRFIEVDPLAEDYVYNSTYSFSENRVTSSVEIEGLEAKDLFNELGPIRDQRGKDGIPKSETKFEKFMDAALLIFAGMIGGAVGEVAPILGTVINTGTTVAKNSEAAPTGNTTPKPEVTNTQKGADKLGKPEASSSPSGRGKNKLQPDKEAQGDYTTFQRDQNGNIYKYQEFKKNDKNPNGFDPQNRFDGGKPDGSPGAPHNGIPTPHVNGKNIPGGVRIPTPREVPNNPRFRVYY